MARLLCAPLTHLGRVLLMQIQALRSLVEMEPRSTKGTFDNEME